MSYRSNTAGHALILALLLCAFAGTVRAQESYPPPALMESSAPSAAERDRQDDEERAIADRREEMIDECEQSHGSELDCERETDTELRAERLRSRVLIIHPRAR